jgi:hypothetical protein
MLLMTLDARHRERGAAGHVRAVRLGTQPRS